MQILSKVYHIIRTDTPDQFDPQQWYHQIQHPQASVDDLEHKEIVKQKKCYKISVEIKWVKEKPDYVADSTGNHTCLYALM